MQEFLREQDVAKSLQARHVSGQRSINIFYHERFGSHVLFSSVHIPLTTVTTSSIICKAGNEERRGTERERNSQLDHFGPGVASRLDVVLRRGSRGLSDGRLGEPASGGICELDCGACNFMWIPRSRRLNAS